MRTLPMRTHDTCTYQLTEEPTKSKLYVEIRPVITNETPTIYIHVIFNQANKIPIIYIHVILTKLVSTSDGPDFVTKDRHCSKSSH